jgi:two-component system, response regulator PdtaR
MVDATAMTMPATGKTTILVVEDEVLVRLMIADALRDEGYTVIEAVNTEEALAVLRSSLPVHLLLTDMRMPGAMDGVALVGVVRREFPMMRVVMASAEQPDDAVRAILDGYLSKPFTASEISRFVRAITPPAIDEIDE